MDLLMAGNKYGFEVETNPCDAGSGVLFLGKGNGQFAWQENIQTGFWAPKEARDMVLLRGANGKHRVIVSNNNSNLQVFD
jgi:hypothetical protein